jgi:hypothetical protein
VKAGERTFFADNLRYKKLICREDLQPGKIGLGKGYSKNGADPIIVGNVVIGLAFENRHRNGRVCQPNRENDRRYLFRKLPIRIQKDTPNRDLSGLKYTCIP